MPIDSADKRKSTLFLHNPSMVTLPTADGTVGQDDRQHVAMSYRGIPASILSLINTRNRRSSVLSYALPWRVFPNPDAVLDAADREHVAMSYAGIPAAAPGGTTLIAQQRGFFRFIFSRFFGRIN